MGTEVITLLLYSRYWFGEKAVGRKSMLLDFIDFDKLSLPQNWNVWTDKNHQGYEIAFPVKIRCVLSFMPTNSSTNFRIPVESINMDFHKTPIDQSADRS